MLDTFYSQEQKCKYQNWLTGLVVCNCKFLVTLYIYWYMFGYHPCFFFTLLKSKAVDLRKAYRGSGVQGDIVLWHPQVWITLPWMLDLWHNTAYQTILMDGKWELYQTRQVGGNKKPEMSLATRFLPPTIFILRAHRPAILTLVVFSPVSDESVSFRALNNSRSSCSDPSPPWTSDQCFLVTVVANQMLTCRVVWSMWLIIHTSVSPSCDSLYQQRVGW